MKKIRRIFSLLFAVVLSFGLFACKNTDNNKNNETENKLINELSTYFKDNITQKYNFTLDVKDYLDYSNNKINTEPKEYKVYSTVDARYNENLNKGLVKYDGYIHNYSLNASKEVVMGQVHFRTFDSAMGRYLLASDISKLYYPLGIHSGDDIAKGSGMFLNRYKETSKLVTTNKNYVEFFLTTLLLEKNYQELKDVVNGAGLELLEVNGKKVLNIFLYSDIVNEVVIEYQVKDLGNTKLDKLDNYIKNNSDYNTSVKAPQHALSSLDDEINIYGDGSYLFDLDVQTYAIEQVTYPSGAVFPEARKVDRDYKLSFKHGTEKATYLVDNENQVILDVNGSLKHATIDKNNEVKIGDLYNTDINKLNLFKIIWDNATKFKLREKTDNYYYNDIETDSANLKETLYTLFNLEKAGLENKDEISGISTSVLNNKFLVSVWITVNDKERAALRLMFTNTAATQENKDIIKYYEEQKSIESLKKLIKDAEAIDLSVYTEETAKKLSDQIKFAKEQLNKNLTLEEIKNIKQALQQDIDNLIKKSTFIQRLSCVNIYNVAINFERDNYTASTFKNLEDSASNLKNLIDNGLNNSTSADIEKVLLPVQEAISNLVKRGSKDVVLNKLTEMQNKDYSNYYVDEVNKILEPLAGLKNMLSSIPEDEFAKTGMMSETFFLNRLELSEAEINKYEYVDSNDLEEEIQICQNLDQSLYEDSSFTKLKSAADKAEKLISGGKVLRKDNNLYLVLLKTLILELKLKNYTLPAEATAKKIKEYLISEVTGDGVLEDPKSYRLEVTTGEENYNIYYNYGKYVYNQKYNVGSINIDGRAYNFSIENDGVKDYVKLGGVIEASNFFSSRFSSDYWRVGIHRISSYAINLLDGAVLLYNNVYRVKDLEEDNFLNYNPEESWEEFNIFFDGKVKFQTFKIIEGNNEKIKVIKDQITLEKNNFNVPVIEDFLLKFEFTSNNYKNFIGQDYTLGLVNDKNDPKIYKKEYENPVSIYTVGTDTYFIFDCFGYKLHEDKKLETFYLVDGKLVKGAEIKETDDKDKMIEYLESFKPNGIFQFDDTDLTIGKKVKASVVSEDKKLSILNYLLDEPIKSEDLGDYEVELTIIGDNTIEVLITFDDFRPNVVFKLTNCQQTIPSEITNLFS